jgi:hypothetical protein
VVFKPGESGNISGVTARVRFREELVARFVALRNRQPDTVELATVDSLAALMARQRKSRGVPTTEIVRMSNAIDRLSARLFEGVRFVGDTSYGGKGARARRRGGLSLAELEGRTP